MTSTNTPPTSTKRKRSSKPGYTKPFNSNIIALILLALLALVVSAIKVFNW